ncbi:S9 family peptidase [Acidobacteria bacterium AB60]|nr:S9 family peptidase [Acidobacteria bacterium AB60]
MTFEDLMAMKRLGETAVSPDGKWLAYSVTTVNLGQNTKTAELWIQPIAGGDPKKIEVTHPGDSGLQFSHDGKSVLFLSSREGGQQVWLAAFDTATGTTTNAKKLTNLATHADNARWSPDDKFIAFTSSVYPDCPAITPANPTTGDACNAGRDAAAASSQVKAQIFTALLYRHWDHFTGPKRSHLFTVAVDNGEVRDLTPHDPHDVPPFSLEGGCGCDISPDARELAFTENPDPVPAISTSAQIYTLDLTNPTAKPVKISTSAGGNFNPAYSPDGKYLAWRSQARAGYEADKFRLFLYDRSAKTAKDLLPKFDNWVYEFTWEATWTDGTQHILFASGERGESALYQTDMGAQTVRRFGQVQGEWSDIHYAVWNGPSVRGQSPVSPDTITHGFDIAIGNLMRVDRPSEIVAGDLVKMNDDSQRIVLKKAGDPTDRGHKLSLYEPLQLTHLNDALLNQLDLPKMESFWFPAADGTKVQGFLIRPPNFDPNKKYPLKFLIHGGPQGAWGDMWSYRWNAELFAANGYVVVMINPRGSTGYGQAFVDGVNGDWGGKPYTDLMTGLDYAEQHYPFIDKSRECALGASYGGYMANWILGHTTRFRCIVSHDGMFNAESAFGSTEEDWFNNWEFQGNPWDYYGKPDDQNPFRKWSPSLYAKNFKTPTLVIHSQLDYRLDVSEGFQLFDTLQLLGVPSKMLYFPDEGHWILKPQNSQLWYKTVNDWVDQWTAPSHKE